MPGRPREKFSPLLLFSYVALALVERSALGLRISSCDVSTARTAARLGPWGAAAHQQGGCRASSRRGVRVVGGGVLRMARDFYEVLEIPETADQSEIKRAYRRKALKTHPDVNAAPTAKEDFAEVVNAYEVLSDEKKRASYNTKRKFTNPFRRGGGGGAGAAGSGGGGGAASWGSSTYNAAREEAARRWREQNPTPEEIGDSFGDIFRDLVGGIASVGGGGGVLNDVVDFLENQVDGFSSDTSVEFEDLMASRNLREMNEELENTRFLLEQLKMKSRKLGVDKLAAEKEVVAMKAGGGSKRFTDIDELDRQMSAIEKAAGIKARYDELQGHVKRAKARLGRLERRVADLESGVGGRRPTGTGSSGTSYGGGSTSYSGSTSTSYGSNTNRSNYSSSSSSSSSSQRRAGSGGGGGGSGDRTAASSGGSSGGSRRTSASSSPPPPKAAAPRRRPPGGKRRTDDPDVEAELARMKRDMGLK